MLEACMQRSGIQEGIHSSERSEVRDGVTTMFKGSMVALVTPMQADGSLDRKSLVDLIEWHIVQKTSAIIVAGTTGEASTLSREERKEITQLAVKTARGRIPIIAGTGSNSTATTILYTQDAEAAGVNACLIVTPYYNKPTQKGLYEHYKMVAADTSLPIILYNVPSRTGVDMLPETIFRLAKIANIIGIKEATGKQDRLTEILNGCDSNFMLYSGDDATALDWLMDGAHGVISVTANVAPLKMAVVCEAVIVGHQDLAEKINKELMPLHTRLFVESNPIPTKWVLSEMGLISTGIRLPLTTLDPKFYPELREAMQIAGITDTMKV
jgi:4-hydroxy-tetrahydrodipicolinate synthase